MRLKQANREFLSGYFSTHQRGEKTQSAYASELAQSVEFAGKNRELRSVKGPVIERWATRLKEGTFDWRAAETSSVFDALFGTS